MAENLYLSLPHTGTTLWSLPFISNVPAANGRKLPNGTILVKDENEANVIWKLTPWEKVEKLIDELSIYAHLLKEGFSDKWIRLLGRFSCFSDWKRKRTTDQSAP